MPSSKTSLEASLSNTNSAAWKIYEGALVDPTPRTLHELAMAGGKGRFVGERAVRALIKYNVLYSDGAAGYRVGDMWSGDSAVSAEGIRGIVESYLDFVRARSAPRPPRAKKWRTIEVTPDFRVQFRI